MQKNDNSVCLTPPSSSSDEESDLLTRFSNQHTELKDRYALCVNNHEIASRKLQILRHENAALRLVNKDLKRLNLLTETSVNLPGISSGFPFLSTINDFRTLSIGDNNGSGGSTTTVNVEKPVQVQPERVTLPMIRSSTYLKINQPNPADHIKMQENDSYPSKSRDSSNSMNSSSSDEGENDPPTIHDRRVITSIYFQIGELKNLIGLTNSHAQKASREAEILEFKNAGLRLENKNLEERLNRLTTKYSVK